MTRAPWALHPTLTALQPSLQITADCWALLAAPDGTSRKEHYLPKGEREPDTAYRKLFDYTRPSGFFRDALRDGAALCWCFPKSTAGPARATDLSALDVWRCRSAGSAGAPGCKGASGPGPQR